MLNEASESKKKLPLFDHMLCKDAPCTQTCASRRRFFCRERFERQYFLPVTQVTKKGSASRRRCPGCFANFPLRLRRLTCIVQLASFFCVFIVFF